MSKKGWGKRDTQDWSEKQYGERDSAKEVARAEHQARNDAVDTEAEVRPAKEETVSSSKGT